MANNRKGTIVEVNASATSDLVLMPRKLVALALLHLLWGGLELFSDPPEAIVDLVIGTFYFVNSLLLNRMVKGAAWATLIVLCILTLLYGFMVVANVVSYGEIKHAKPMVLFVLGTVCIFDTRRRLKNWEGLKAKRVAQRMYQRPFSVPAIVWLALSYVWVGAWVVAVLAFVYLRHIGHTDLATTILFFMIWGLLAAATYWFPLPQPPAQSIERRQRRSKRRTQADPLTPLVC